jgi:NDP-sugar pyrophosphorylase family protein
VPKSLLAVRGKAFIEHQIEMLCGWGLSDLVLCLGHLGDQIVTHLGDGSSCGARIEYSIEDGPLGTAGAIKKARDLLGSEFLAIYGDSYLFLDPADMARRFRLGDKLALMTVYRNNDRFDRSNVAIHE